MLKLCFYLDGRYLTTDAKKLDVFTPGRQPYYGVFETMRVQDQRIEYLDEHVMRLQAGLNILKIAHQFTAPKIKGIVKAVVKKNPGVALGRLRLMVFQEGSQLHCACMVMPYKAYALRKHQEGLKAMIIKTKRPAHSRYADVKSLDYAVFSNALSQAISNGYDEAILLNARGNVFETSRGNIFILYQGQWITPPLSSGCLNGIMRAKVLAFAKRIGLAVKARNITVPMLAQAEEVLMTNSLIGAIKLAVGVK